MKIAQIQREVVYKTARSSGSGGQHVNKVETKVELYFDVTASEGLSETEKNRLYKKLVTRISKDGILKVAAQNTRSQVRNKELAWERFVEILKIAIQSPKIRKPTQRSAADNQKRLHDKRLHSEKKSRARKVALGLIH